MLKTNKFELKLAAMQLQTRLFKFINARIYALSVTNAHFIFARISYINFFVSHVSAQSMKSNRAKDIGEGICDNRFSEAEEVIFLKEVSATANILDM